MTPDDPLTTCDRFAEQLPALSEAEALTEARRCLYCFDAPCMHACPTHIDIPSFIRKISTGNLRGSALTILEANHLGGTCARVCPVEELCQGACVLNGHTEPIEIGRLQRHATDYLAARERQPFRPGEPTGKTVLVVGSGPAGLSAAAELAKLGHGVTVWEKRELAGGLSTYGIIPLREPMEVALGEVEMVKDLGVEVITGRALGPDELDSVAGDYDAVFLATGLGAVPAMDIPGGDAIIDGLDYIAEAKLHPETESSAAKVVVIGAGNTAIDAATIARRRGAEVTIVYRRTATEMTAYDHEYEFALSEGIAFSFLTQPVEVLRDGDAVTGVRCSRMRLGEPDPSGRRRPEPIEGEELEIPCDLVVRAIGQELHDAGQPGFGLDLHHGYIAVDEGLRTSADKVWAGGDAVRSYGDASTVMGVQDGKIAAASIHEALTGQKVAEHQPTSAGPSSWATTTENSGSEGAHHG